VYITDLEAGADIPDRHAALLTSHLIDGMMRPHGTSTKMEMRIIETRRRIPLNGAQQ
jgi:hypothetical protein